MKRLWNETQTSLPGLVQTNAKAEKNYKQKLQISVIRGFKSLLGNNLFATWSSKETAMDRNQMPAMKSVFCNFSLEDRKSTKFVNIIKFYATILVMAFVTRTPVQLHERQICFRPVKSDNKSPDANAIEKKLLNGFPKMIARIKLFGYKKLQIRHLNDFLCCSFFHALIKHFRNEKKVFCNIQISMKLIQMK